MKFFTKSKHVVLHSVVVMSVAFSAYAVADTLQGNPELADLAKQTPLVTAAPAALEATLVETSAPATTAAADNTLNSLSSAETSTAENSTETVEAFKRLKASSDAALETLVDEEAGAQLTQVPEATPKTVDSDISLKQQSVDGLKPRKGRLPSFQSFNQTGVASWYGAYFHGRLTANGERYNMHEMTAAHKSLPLNSLVKVTNLANNRTLVVRVNDRGPYVGSRIIDLSQAAAIALGYKDRGMARVRIETVDGRKILQ